MSSLHERLRRHLGEPSTLRPADPSEAAAVAEPTTTPATPDEGSVGRRLSRMFDQSPAARHTILGTGRRRPEPSEVDGDATRSGAHAFAPPTSPPPTDPRRPPTPPPVVPQELQGDARRAWLFGHTVLPAGHRHGSVALDRVLDVDGHGALLLSGDPTLTAFDPTRALFFDLETTGLMGGGGNLAFIVGVASIDARGEVDLMQFQLREPGDEPAMLQAVLPLIEQADFLVSFNGKSFDRHVLADRFVMNRMDPDPVLDTPHLDLIHPARRLFKGSLSSCSLGRLEERRLSVFRQDDLPGSEAPAAWFAWLRTGDSAPVRRVLDHNALDLLSLIALCADLDRCVRAPGAALPDPAALAAAGRLLIERGAADRGEHILQLLICGDAADPVVYGSLHVLAEHYRKQERHAEALPLWTRMRQAAGTADLRPWLCEVIALEHRLGRAGDALGLVGELLARLDRGSQVSVVPTGDMNALHRRRERLERKVRARLSP